MPLIAERDDVLASYAQMAQRGWVMPCFCTENAICTEAILAAAAETAEAVGCPDLPVTLAMTHLYPHRAQAPRYSQTGDPAVGLAMWLADLRVLAAPPSPYHRLRVLTHLDHVQPGVDDALLGADLGAYSSIMFDASARPFDENIEATRRFVEARGETLVIEGACDEIVDAGGNETGDLTTPERAEAYRNATGVDFMVANLGTEHRASQAELLYRGELAGRIAARTGGCLVLHGCSSVPQDQIRGLFDDGIRKVNVWAALERDSAPALLAEMARHASRVAGADLAGALREEGVLGPAAETETRADLEHFPTSRRQAIVFAEMKRIVRSFLSLWIR
jgi:fructose-bisphosphate aldolase class II